MDVVSDSNVPVFPRPIEQHGPVWSFKDGVQRGVLSHTGKTNFHVFIRFQNLGEALPFKQTKFKSLINV